MKPGQWAPIAVAAAIVCAVVWFGFDADDTTPAPEAAVQARTGPPRPAGSVAHAARGAPAVPGAALVDPARLFELGFAGGLQLDIDTAAALEVISADLGPDPTPADLNRLDDALRKGLPPGAATEAIAMVHRHRAYSADHAKLFANPPAVSTFADERAMLDRVDALQRHHFGEATAKALFGLQQANSRHQLDVQAIEADERLSPADKAQRIEALRDALPPEVAELQAVRDAADGAASAGTGGAAPTR